MITASLGRHKNTQHTANTEELELVDRQNEPTQCLASADKQEDILDIEVENFKGFPYLLSTQTENIFSGLCRGGHNRGV